MDYIDDLTLWDKIRIVGFLALILVVIVGIFIAHPFIRRFK